MLAFSRDFFSCNAFDASKLIYLAQQRAYLAERQKRHFVVHVVQGARAAQQRHEVRGGVPGSDGGSPRRLKKKVKERETSRRMTISNHLKRF